MELIWLVSVGVGGLVIGGGLGYLMFRLQGNTGKRVRELETALESSREELSGYRREVYEQFAETARKFKDLDDSYHSLHRQLAVSAQALVGEAAGPLLAAPTEREAADADELDEALHEAELAAQVHERPEDAEPDAEPAVRTPGAASEPPVHLADIPGAQDGERPDAAPDSAPAAARVADVALAADPDQADEAEAKPDEPEVKADEPEVKQARSP